MYHNISNNVFASKYLLPNTMYEVSAGYQCVRLRPYSGSHNFDWLRWCEKDPNRVMIPLSAKKLAGIPNRVYAIQIGDTFYLIDPQFKGDPTTIAFKTQPTFRFISEDPALYDEAKNIATSDMCQLRVMKYNGIRPKINLSKELRERIGCDAKDNTAITSFNWVGRQWIEVRSTKCFRTGLYPQDDRITTREFVPELNGITVLGAKASELSLISLFPDDWDIEHLVGWYSKVRNAIIIESEPKPCAVCGKEIRSIDREHFYAKACDDCIPHLGHGKAFDAIMSAQRATKSAEEIIKAY